MAKSKKEPDGLDVPVQFGNVGLGKEVARLGVKIRRNGENGISLKKAAELLCNSRLAVVVTIDDPQDTLPNTGVEKPEIRAEADVKKFMCGGDVFGASLAFTKTAINVGDLSKFAGKTGRLVATRVGPASAAADADGAEEEEDDGEPKLPGTDRANTP